MRPKVLTVEDAATLTAVKRALKASFDVEGFSDAEAAASFARDATFDIALIGVNPAGVDGLALLEQLRRSRPDVPVVMLSGDASPELVVRAMKRGASDFVTGPLDDSRALATRLHAAMIAARTRNGIDALLARLGSDSQPLPRYSDVRLALLNEFQRAYLERLMRDSKGNLSAASRLSGIDRANLRRALQKQKKSR